MLRRNRRFAFTRIWAGVFSYLTVGACLLIALVVLIKALPELVAAVVLLGVVSAGIAWVIQRYFREWL